MARAEAYRYCTGQSIAPPLAGGSNLIYLDRYGACAALTCACPFSTLLFMHNLLTPFVPLSPVLPAPSSPHNDHTHADKDTDAHTIIHSYEASHAPYDPPAQHAQA